MSYKHHLAAGARCVEIDAWDNEDDEQEPKGMSRCPRNPSQRADYYPCLQSHMASP